MGRPLRKLPIKSSGAHPLPPADDVVRTLGGILSPLIRLLLASGTDFTRLAAELKPIFIEQALLELLRTGQRPTDSAISLLSGVHRKDVRAWRENSLPGRIAQEASVSSQVFARWLQDPLYRDRRRHPKPLPRLGPAPSFDALARSVTQDVHPYTVLTDLLRLGLVRVETVKGEEMVFPHRDGFVPAVGSREILDLLGANVADHATAAVSNVLGHSPTLEQSVFADGITADSAEALGALARKLWAQARSEMIAEASRRYDTDRGRADATHRMRFGSYYWSQDIKADGTGQIPSAKGEKDDKNV